MSRIGRNPVEIPKEVSVDLAEDLLTISGQLGQLSLFLTAEIEISIENSKLWVKPRRDDKYSRAMWGTTRANISNMVLGVEKGFTKRLEIVGVGYKAALHGKILNLSLGFSHEISYSIPEDITVRCDSPTLIEVSGSSKERVGQVAADIRAYRPPEPYKGKGIKYFDEKILRKEGKKK